MNKKTESSHKNFWKERKIKNPKERAKTKQKRYKGIPILLVCTFTWTHDSAKKTQPRSKPKKVAGQREKDHEGK